jgi:tetratricopeptide (TPR) repeat protein
MGSKRKRHGKPQAAGLFERARRELAKGNAKPALKDAKLCFRNDPSPQCRQLLEEAYLGRIEQLRAMRQFGDARAILSELMKFHPSAPAVRQQIPRLQVMLGEHDEDSARLLEAQPMLLAELADEAVLDSRCTVPDHAAVKTQVEQVRQALWSVEQDDDEAATQALLQIPRNSPLADWKLFVRGLSAFYQRDKARVGENWRRLDPARPAWRIAQTLLVATGQVHGEDVAVDVKSNVRRLERSLQTDVAQDSLRRLSSHWQKNDWKEFFREYRALRQRFAKSHAKLIETIVELTWKRSVREGDSSMLAEIIRLGPAPSMDPHWHRARAMMAEYHGGYEVSPVTENWTAYAEEVAKLECISESERAIAAGLVYLHLARKYSRYAQDNEKLNRVLPPDQDDDSVELFQQDAARCYRKAIECSERVTAAYHELAELHEQRSEPEKGAAVLLRLARTTPDDFKAHIWLANYYLGRDRPDKSEPHVTAALRLKPRDKQTETLRWNQRLTTIRCLVKKRLFEAARQEVDDAATHVPSDIEPYFLDVIRACIELKAKNDSAAQQQLAAALDKVDEPTAVFAHMSCLAARYGLPREIKKDFDSRFKEAIKRKPSSETTGRLARFLLMLKQAKINYTGRATQERLFLKYLKRTKRLAWRKRDLQDVCALVSQLSGQRPLFERLLAVGVRRFPDSAELHLLAGEQEMEAGPIFCNYRKARHHMERALELARADGRSQDDELIEQAQWALAQLGDNRPIDSPTWMFEDDENVDDDEEEEDECDFDEAAAPWAEASNDGPVEELSASQVWARLRQGLPPELVALLEGTAQKIGTSPEEMLETIMEKERNKPKPGQAAGRTQASRRRTDT